MSVQEIFSRDGEPFFRDKEAQVIERLLESQRGILSTGGGAFLAERNRQAISDKGVSVWLNAALPVLWQRVKHKDTRPLLRTDDPRGTLEQIYNERVPVYSMVDIAVVSRSKYSVEEMAQQVIAALLKRPDVLEEVIDA